MAGRLEAETDLVVDLADGLLGEDVSLVAVGNRHGWDELEGNKSESSSRDADAGRVIIESHSRKNGDRQSEMESESRRRGRVDKLFFRQPTTAKEYLAVYSFEYSLQA